MAQGDFTRINSNIGALNSLNSLKAVQAKMGKAQLALATGKAINEAADDPAGLTIATKFQYRSSGLGQALSNIGDAKNMLAVAEGGLSKVNDILIKMRDKATQAASDTLGSAERYAIKQQLDDFATEINDIVETTKWNNKKLLNGLGDFDSSTVTFQVGVDTESNNKMTLAGGSFGSVSTTGLSIGATASTATEAVDGGAILTATPASATIFSGLSELSTGTYTVRVVVGAVGGAGNTAVGTAQLLDTNGNLLTVDPDETTGGALSNSVTFTYDNDTAAAGNNVDFGNGLTVTFGTGIGTGTTSATVSYSRAGTYSGQVDTAANATTAITALEDAISTVSSRLQKIGTMVSRLNFREESLSIAQVNTEAAYSRIMNADMAFQQLESTKYSILQQTATAMLSQANSAPQGILSLFR